VSVRLLTPLYCNIHLPDLLIWSNKYSLSTLIYFIYFLPRMPKILQTEKKSNLEDWKKQCTVHASWIQFIKWQLNFLGHIMIRYGLKNLVTVIVEGRRVRRYQRLKYLDSLSTRWKPSSAHQVFRGASALAIHDRQSHLQWTVQSVPKEDLLFKAYLHCAQFPKYLLRKSLYSIASRSIILVASCSSWHSTKVVKADTKSQYHINYNVTQVYMRWKCI